jgi:hypothetical protein
LEDDWFADFAADTDELVVCAALLRMMEEYLARELYLPGDSMGRL